VLQRECGWYRGSLPSIGRVLVFLDSVCGTGGVWEVQNSVGDQGQCGWHSVSVIYLTTYKLWNTFNIITIKVPTHMRSIIVLK
jgi:hypothetical protein